MNKKKNIQGQIKHYASLLPNVMLITKGWRGREEKQKRLYQQFLERNIVLW